MTTEIIIPAYNEAQRIGKTLQSYIDYFPEDVRFFVVLNGCTDSTETIVSTYAQKYPHRLRYEVITEAIGKGGAILHGFKKATSALVGFVDADGATAPEEYDKLISALDGHDGAIASRFIQGAVVEQRQSHLRTIMSYVFIHFVQLLFHMPYTDTQCGAKIFRKNVITSVVQNITHHDMTFDVELLFRIHKNGYSIREVPTIWVDQPGSAALGTRTKFLYAGIDMVKRLVQLKRALRS